jgi:hypothetical protein
MTAFKDYYLPKVEKELAKLLEGRQRKLTEKEIEDARILYSVKGWHPTRVAMFINENAKKEGKE